mmetsp:Transcript_2735/g.6114  ORF Transcript_2735/g.6114 Transcript_2735/m.6114 type:complete len:550 (-) Transcript_2735:110-1759(-)
MSDRDIIDLAASSSDDEASSDYSAELLSPMPTRTSRTGACQQSQNRKRAAAITKGDLVVNVSSSPTLSPAKMTAKTKKEKNQESRNRAREWRDNRKRGTTGRGVNNAAGRGSEVFNLSSPSPPTPVRNKGSCASRDAATARTPARQKMSKSKKQEARARARQWHDNRPENQKKRSSYHNNEENSSEEAVELSTSSSDDSPAGNHLQEQVRLSNQAPFTAALEMREPQYHSATRPLFAAGSMLESPLQHHRHRAVSSFAASGGGLREIQREEETQQWPCPMCTLLNPQHQSRCGACYHENFAQQSNRGGGEGTQVYDVDSDGDFVLESEQNNQRSQRPFNNHTYRTEASTAGTAGEHRYGVARSNASLHGRGGSTSSEFITRAILQPSHTTSAGGFGGRQRTFNSTSFGGGVSRSPMVGHSASRNSSFLSQFLLSMEPRHSNAFRQLQGHGENVDNMSYERLLQVFGDGSENRGASSEAISSLPVSKIGDPELELPDDKRQCSICLDDFCRGDERTTLPCLHGFHSACVNRWLSSNGACPVCKTSVSGSR